MISALIFFSTIHAFMSHAQNFDDNNSTHRECDALNECSPTQFPQGTTIIFDSPTSTIFEPKPQLSPVPPSQLSEQNMEESFVKNMNGIFQNHLKGSQLVEFFFAPPLFPPHSSNRSMYGIRKGQSLPRGHALTP